MIGRTALDVDAERRALRRRRFRRGLLGLVLLAVIIFLARYGQ